MPSTWVPGVDHGYREMVALAPVPRDAADGEELVEHEVPVLDRERVAVERAHGRAGRAVALGVVEAAVARAPERLREHGAQLDPPTFVIASSSIGPFGCTGQPRCTQRL